MASALAVERSILDELEPRWRSQGYDLIRAPSRDQLPPFLTSFQPDAIAVGQAPALVIEVLSKRGEPSNAKIRQLQHLLMGHEDWRLEVVYAARNGRPLQPVEGRDIRTALRQVGVVSESEPRAGLLMAWATLEAIARKLEPKLAARGLTSASLVDLLISNGHLPQNEGARMRKLAEMRNALAHGQIDACPDRADIRYLTELGERLAA